MQRIVDAYDYRMQSTSLMITQSTVILMVYFPSLAMAKPLETHSA